MNVHAAVSTLTSRSRPIMAQGQDTVVHAAHGGSDARFVADAVVEKLNRGNLDLLKSAGIKQCDGLARRRERLTIR